MEYNGYQYTNREEPKRTKRSVGMAVLFACTAMAVVFGRGARNAGALRHAAIVRDRTRGNGGDARKQYAGFRRLCL